jgi:hypothetical protein
MAGVVVALFDRDGILFTINAAGAVVMMWTFFQRIVRAHFDWLSNSLALFGLPLFAVLLVNSYISHKKGCVSWKGRTYGSPERGFHHGGTEGTEKE